MDSVPTTWPIFLTILALYTAVSLFILGGKQAFFEPFDESKALPEPGQDHTFN